MKLDEWLKRNGLTPAEFSRQSGVDEANVSKWRNGVHFPRGINLEKIIKATGGAVTANDFLPEGALK